MSEKAEGQAKEAPSSNSRAAANSSIPAAPATVKRPRGRSRKHPTPTEQQAPASVQSAAVTGRKRKGSSTVSAVSAKKPEKKLHKLKTDDDEHHKLVEEVGKMEAM